MDVAKAGACVQDFAGTLSAIARNLRVGLLESMGRSAASIAASVQKNGKSSRCAGAGSVSAKGLVARQ